GVPHAAISRDRIARRVDRRPSCPAAPRRAAYRSPLLQGENSPVLPARPARVVSLGRRRTLAARPQGVSSSKRGAAVLPFTPPADRGPLLTPAQVVELIG